MNGVESREMVIRSDLRCSFPNRDGNRQQDRSQYSHRGRWSLMLPGRVSSAFAQAHAFVLHPPGFLDVFVHILAKRSSFRFDFLSAAGCSPGRCTGGPDPLHHLPERIVLRQLGQRLYDQLNAPGGKSSLSSSSSDPSGLSVPSTTTCVALMDLGSAFVCLSSAWPCALRSFIVGRKPWDRMRMSSGRRFTPFDRRDDQTHVCRFLVRARF